MIPITPPSNYTTRTAARAYAVKPAETPQPTEEALANYDKSNTAAAAGFLLIPTVGLSLLCYDHHHTKLTQEKIEANFALAKAIINAPVTPLPGGRYKLKAGGFVFTEVLYENNPRVMVRKSYAAAPSVTFEAMLNVEECENTSHYISDWELLLKRLTFSAPDPVILIDGELTVQDIQLRAANLIRTKAEMEARSVFANMPPACRGSADEILTDEITDDFIKMAGIYALAFALLTPEEANEEDDYVYVQQYIEENSDSLNILKEIFGFPQPDDAKRCVYSQKCSGVGARFARSKVPADQTKLTWVGRTLHMAITCCFNALSLYCDGNSFKNTNNRDSFETISF